MRYSIVCGVEKSSVGCGAVKVGTGIVPNSRNKCYETNIETPNKWKQKKNEKWAEMIQ